MSLVVYAAFDRELRANLDEAVQLRAGSNLERIDLTRSPPTLKDGVDPGRELSSGEAVLRLYSADGLLLSDGSPASGASASEREVVQASIRAGHDVYRTVNLSDGDGYRIVASPIFTDAGIAGVLVTGIEHSRVNQPLNILRVILLIIVPITAVALGLGGYWIASRALRPVAVMATTARHITQGDLRRRIEGVDSNDELGQLSAVLNEMIVRLADTLEHERHFTADASHELRTPLAAIEASIDVTLSRERDPSEYRRVLQIVRDQTQRMHLLVDQLLLLSRLDADAVQAGFTAVELAGLLGAVIESFQASYPDAHVTLLLTDEPLVVWGDIDLLARAMLNVLENAVTHAGRTVSITVRARREHEGMALVTIEDDGPGISEDLMQVVFHRFRRGDTAPSGSGAGLGLPIVESILRAHGGSVKLEPSSLGHGARFELTVPLLNPGCDQFSGLY
jgi:signal transduction histidine kinase